MSGGDRVIKMGAVGQRILTETESVVRLIRPDHWTQSCFWVGPFSAWPLGALERS